MKEVSGRFEREKNKMKGAVMGGGELEVRGSYEVSHCSFTSPAEKNSLHTFYCGFQDNS